MNSKANYMIKILLRLSVFVVIIILLAFSSCKNNEVGNFVTTQVLDTLNLDYANNGKRIYFSGYLSFGHLPAFVSKTYIAVESDNTVKMEAFDDTSYNANRLANLKINYGTGANSISYPEKDFTDEEVVVTTNDKQKLNLFQKVSISGTVSLDKKTKTTMMKTFRIEGSLIPSVRTVTKYDMTLTDIRIDKIK
jgi:hypothetical protein